jgi:Mce-associated membrane protein
MKSRQAVLVPLVLTIVCLATVASILALRLFDATAIDRARTESMASAKHKVPELLSYDYRLIADYARLAKNETTEPFQSALAKVISDRVAPEAVRRKLSVTTGVQEVSVASATKDSAVLLVFANQETRDSAHSAPELSGYRVRVEMRLVLGNWLVSGITPL